MTQHDPFHHQHPPDDDARIDELDPAQQSFADALRWTFRLLKWAMLAMLVIYLFSNIFKIPQQDFGLRLQFGRIVGNEILEPGGPYFAWPFPIEQVVRIPRDVQQMKLRTQFWYEIDEQRALQTSDELIGRPGPLNPEKDGSLLTGDANICHAIFSVTYKITKPTDFIRNVGDPDRNKAIQAAETVVRNAAEQGIVYTIAQVKADDFQKGLTIDDIQVAKMRIQGVLDTLGTGIRVLSVSADRTVFPISVQADFQAVINADTEKAQQIEEAEQYRADTLGKTAGQVYEPLLALIGEYELAGQSRDAKNLEELDDRFDKAFTKLEVDTEQGPRRIGGDAALIINEAKTYRTQVVAEIRAEADYFEALLPQYRENPKIVRNRLWQDTIKQIFDSADEIIWVPKGHIWVDISRNSELRRQRELEDLKKEQEKKENEPSRRN